MADQEKRFGWKLADLDTRVAEVAREQRRVNQLLGVDDNWHSEVKSWIGHSVVVHLQDGNALTGTLKWVDKFQLAVIPPGRTKDDPQIINKGAISFTERHREESENAE